MLTDDDASAARPGCGSTPAAPARASPPTCWPTGSKAAGPSTAAATCASAAPTTSRSATRSPATSIHTLHVEDGAVATSGIDMRLWRAPDGTPRHHLLDPSTGAPAWTGLISVTALAPTALEAEALAKAALLSGPRARPGGSNATAVS